MSAAAAVSDAGDGADGPQLRRAGAWNTHAQRAITDFMEAARLTGFAQVTIFYGELKMKGFAAEYAAEPQLTELQQARLKASQAQFEARAQASGQRAAKEKERKKKQKANKAAKKAEAAAAAAAATEAGMEVEEQAPAPAPTSASPAQQQRRQQPPAAAPLAAATVPTVVATWRHCMEPQGRGDTKEYDVLVGGGVFVLNVPLHSKAAEMSPHAVSQSIASGGDSAHGQSMVLQVLLGPAGGEAKTAQWKQLDRGLSGRLKALNPASFG